MDTTAKGNAFENIVFKLIQEELKNDRLGLSTLQARLFQKKGYFSKDRDSKIVVDISIEVWPKTAKNYSILWVCECKDYEHPIPINDVEEFKAKLDQIAGKNVKGVVASRNSLQKAALAYAQANGIGVLRILPNDQVDWVMSFIISLERVSLSLEECNLALTSQNYRGVNNSFYAMSEGQSIRDLRTLLTCCLENTRT